MSDPTESIAVAPESGIAIQMWRNGVGSFESRADLTPASKTGSFGTPGKYDQIEQQFYRVAAHMDTARAAAEGVEIETVPLENETANEAAANEVIESIVVGDRLRLETGDGYATGFGSAFAKYLETAWYGWDVWDPYWSDERGPAGADLCFRPLLRAAVSTFGIIIPPQVRPSYIEYMADGIYQRLDYSRVIHFTYGGGPGELFGRGILRSVLPLFEAWRGGLITQEMIEAIWQGVVVAEAPGEEDKVNRTAMKRAIQAYLDGDLRAIMTAKGYTLDLKFPAGSAPPVLDKMQWIEACVDLIFASRMSSLGISQSGSRAVAEELRADDAKIDRVRLDRAVNRFWTKIAGYVAASIGYRGRLRKVKTLGEDSVDVAALVTMTAEANQANALGEWTREDAAWLRERGGWPAMSGGVAQPGAQPTRPRVSLMSDRRRRATASASLNDSDDHEPGCGCGSHSFSDPVEFVSGGRPWVSYRKPVEVDVDGVICQPEAFVSWADQNDELDRLAVELDADLAQLVGQHRADSLELLTQRGFNAPALETLFAEWRARYEARLARYIQAVSDVSRSTMQEARVRQGEDAKPTKRTGLSAPILDRMIDDTEQRVNDGVTRAADAIASRVQSSIESGYLAGGPQGAAVAAERQTIRGLAGEVSAPVSQTVEAAALDVATESDDGLVVIALVRTSMRDGDRVCEHCKTQDGITFRFPEDQARFEEYRAVNGPPDPQCEGGASKCRCGVVPVYGRED